MGCRSNSVNEFSTLRGGLDDLALYDGVLSEAEVQALYNDVSAFDPSADSRLVLYYDFNNPSSDTVLNKAPSTSGSYPLVLGIDRIKAKAMDAPNYVDVSEKRCEERSESQGRRCLWR